MLLEYRNNDTGNLLFCIMQVHFVVSIFTLQLNEKFRQIHGTISSLVLPAGYKFIIFLKHVRCLQQRILFYFTLTTHYMHC